MDFEALLTILKEMENGQQMIDAINTHVKAKEKVAVSKQKEKVAELETAKGKLQETLDKVLEELGVDGESEDFEGELKAAMDSLGDSKGDLGELKKQVNKLNGQLKRLASEKEIAAKMLEEERGRRHGDLKNNALFKELTNNKATAPDQISKLLMSQVKVDDDDSLIFLCEDGTETSVEEGVKSYLSKYPQFVQNTQNPGAGTSVGSTGSGLSFAAQLAKDQAEGSQKQIEQQQHYFGGGN